MAANTPKVPTTAEQEARARRVVPKSPTSGDVNVMKQEEATARQIIAALLERNKKALDLVEKADKTIANAAAQGQNVAALTRDPARVERAIAKFDVALADLRSLVKGVKQELKESDELLNKGPRRR